MDPVLISIIRVLRRKHRCHTILLYGSRVHGTVDSTSDYDVLGVRRSGTKTRIAKKQKGVYWDIFIYPEKDLRKLGNAHRHWKNAEIIYGDGRFGRQLLTKLKKLSRKPFIPPPKYELNVMRVWAQKELDRCKAGGVQGSYRRAELQSVLIEHYFVMRRKRYEGPKAGLHYLKTRDPVTYKLIERALKKPTHLSYLEAAVSRVYRLK